LRRTSEIFKTGAARRASLQAMIDLDKALQFMDTHARLIDRRRFDLLFGGGDPAGALAALAGYANADGGVGWALEADLRSASSQPGAALHAFELLEEVAPTTSPLAVRLSDWLDSVSLPDGGIPFALPGAEGPGSAPWWAGADQSRSSLHITSAVCGIAHRVAEHDPAVAEHRWLARSTDFCLREIADLERPRGAIEFRFILHFLDALHDRNADAARELVRLGRFLPESGAMPVEGGAEGEQIRPLEFAPLPDGPLRGLLAAEAIAADLDRLAGEQLEDGGWEVDWRVSSPAAALEWRGWATVHALTILRANGRLEPDPAGSVRRSSAA
jgi:hypothetical protein